jgi:hypothetical protein
MTNTLKITKIRKVSNYYPMYNNIRNTDSNNYKWQEIYFSQVFSPGSNLVLINNFTDATYTGSPPHSLMYDFTYKTCVSNCSPLGYSGFLQYNGKKTKFEYMLQILKITNQATQAVEAPPGNHEHMKLTIYIDDHQINSSDKSNDWVVNTDTAFHWYVDVATGKSLNSRIEYNPGSGYYSNVLIQGYVAYRPYSGNVT